MPLSLERLGLVTGDLVILPDVTSAEADRRASLKQLGLLSGDTLLLVENIGSLGGADA